MKICAQIRPERAGLALEHDGLQRADMLRSGAIKAIDNLVDRFVCVAGAIAFSQGPEFIQQYLQRLGGHLAEIRRQLAGFESAAKAAGLTVDELARKTSADPALAQLGSMITTTSSRASALQAAHDAIQEASIWTRPFAFLRHVDWEIATGTWNVYRPAFPTTMEGVIYGAAGVVAFLLAYQSLRLLATRALQRPGAMRKAVSPNQA